MKSKSKISIDANELLTLLNATQLKHSEHNHSVYEIFKDILRWLSLVTHSEYGFIGIPSHNGVKPIIKTYFVSNKSTKGKQHTPPKSFQMHSVLERVIAKEKSLIQNNFKQSSKEEVPEGCPALKTFMAVPLSFRGKVIAVMGAVNSESGYSTTLLNDLSLCFTASANLLHQKIETDKRFHSEIQVDYVNLEEKSRIEFEKLISVVEYSNDFISVSAIDGQILYLNKAGRKLIGMELEEKFDATNLLDYVADNEKERLQNKIIPYVLDKGRWVGEVDFQHFKTKEKISVVFDLFRIDDPKTKEPVSIATVSRDVRAEKEDEEDIQRLSSIVEASSDLIGYNDMMKKPVFLNSAGREMLGIEKKEKLTKGVMEYMPEYEHDRFVNEIIPTVYKEGRWSGELDRKNIKTGDIIHTLTDLFIIRDPKTNEASNVAIIAKDVGNIKAIENEITRSEKALKLAQKIGKVGSWELDLISNRLYWSEEIYRLLQIPPFSVKATYETFLNLIHPDDREEVDRAYTNHIQHKIEYNIVHRLLLKDGLIKYVHERCESEWDEQGNPIRSLGTVADVTEQKLVELELEKHQLNLEKIVEQRTQELLDANNEAKAALDQMAVSEENYRFLAENAYGAVLQFDEQMNCTYMSPSIEKLTGFTVTESLNMTPLEYVHPDDLERLMNYYKEDVKNKSQSRVFRYRRLKKGGDYMWVETAATHKYDKQNNLVGTIINIRDISIQKRAEDELEESKNFVQELFQVSKMGLALNDMDGRLIEVNQAYADIVGYTIEEVVNKTYWEITPEKYGDDEANQLESLRKTGKYGPYEKEYIHKKGHLVPVRLQGTIVHRHGTKYIWSSVEDITDWVTSQKKLEDARSQLIVAEKMASLGVLMAGIAHEINNPVNFISAGISSLEENIDGIWKLMKAYNEIDSENFKDKLLEIQRMKFRMQFESNKKFIDRSIVNVKKGVKRTSEIVKGLNTFSRDGVNQLIETDIHESIDTSLLMLKGQYKDRITVIKAYGNLPKIPCYPGRIGQVFLNILVNAIQAIEAKGTIIIDTKLERKSDNLFAKISIKDNGIGMSKENTRRIFEPFFTTKTIGKGTGLGLSISHGIIDDHNGKINVKSTKGKGTTFDIYLPAK